MGEETIFKTTSMLLSTNTKRIVMTRHSKRRTGQKKKNKNLMRQEKTSFARLVTIPRPVGVPKKAGTAHRPFARRISKYCV